MNYFTNTMTQDEAKKVYRKLAVQMHPDKGGKHIDFVRMQNEYEAFLRGEFMFTSKQASEQATAEKDFAFAEEWVNECDGLTIEITGTWIWLCGNSFPYKTIIKENGFKWSNAKKKWYRAPEGTQMKRKRGTSFEKIQKTYGYTASTIKSDSIKRIA